MIVLPEARADLRGVRERRAQFSEESAADLILALVRRVRQIRDFPQSGRMIPEFQHPALREMLEQGFRVMYEVFEDRTEVFGVLHSRQDIRPPG